MAIYASLQTTFNQFLLPRIEAFLLRFSAFQTMKNHNDTASVPKVPTIKDLNQATPDVIEPTPTTKEAISEPSEYEVMRTNAIAKQNHAIQTRLEKVLSYTKQTMVPYMSEEDLNRLCTYVAEYSTGDTLQKISPVKVDSQLKSIDIMHFGWNIGKAFGKSVFIPLPSSRMSLPILSAIWRLQLLNVRCHIQNLNVKLSSITYFNKKCLWHNFIDEVIKLTRKDYHLLKVKTFKSFFFFILDLM